jgi:kynureninase
MSFEPGIAFAQRLDEQDQLAQYRDRFHIPGDKEGRELVYLCGNSLGLQPKTVRDYIERELKDWELLGVRGHLGAHSPWLSYHEQLTEPTARLVGARPSEVVVMNNLTANLHLMMVSFYRPTPDRYKVVIEPNAFPSDNYAVQSQVRFHGFDPTMSIIELTPRSDEAWVRTEDIERVLANEGDRIALVMLGAVNYYSGQFFEMERITRAARSAGCVAGFDLAHAIGNVPMELHDWDVDFAVWCSYKYLNGGPGSIGGCFVHERHARSFDLPRFAGWWGHNKQTRFEMGPLFDPIPGAEGWQLSNPSILPMAALRASMEIFEEVGMKSLREKSERLTGYLEFLLDELHSDHFSIITPRDPRQRGAQLSLRVPRNGKQVHERISHRGIVCDWREPDVIRIGPAPLYNSFTDAFRFVETFREALLHD